MAARAKKAAKTQQEIADDAQRRFNMLHVRYAVLKSSIAAVHHIARSMRRNQESDEEIHDDRDCLLVLIDMLDANADEPALGWRHNLLGGSKAAK
jgi:hypothetical protein